MDWLYGFLSCDIMFIKEDTLGYLVLQTMLFSTFLSVRTSNCAALAIGVIQDSESITYRQTCGCYFAKTYQLACQIISSIPREGQFICKDR